MKTTIYEIRKQTSGRLLPVVLALLIVINVAFCLYYSRSNQNIDVIDRMKAAEKIFKSDPDTVYGIIERYGDEYEAYNKAVYEYAHSIGKNKDAKSPVKPDVPETYYPGTDDYILFTEYFSNIMSADEYAKLITDRIGETKKMLVNYVANGYEQNTYTFNYMVDYIDTYTAVLDRTVIREGYDYGWDVLFTYSGTGLFIFLASIFVGSRLFLIERERGMNLIIRTVRSGRKRLALAKLLTACVLALLITIAFTLSTITVIMWSSGLSSPFDSVQQVEKMLYCPYNIDMLGALLISIAVMSLASLAIILLTAFLSLVFKSAPGCMLGAAAFVGLSYYFFNSRDNEFIKTVNIFTAACAEKLLGNWHVVRFWTEPVNQIIPLAILFAIILVFSSALVFAIWSSRGLGVSSSRGRALLLNLRRLTEKIPNISLKTFSLFIGECRKTFRLRPLIICLLLIIINLGVSLGFYNGTLTYEEEAKLQYIDEYKGNTLDEAYAKAEDTLEYYKLIVRPEYTNEITSKLLKGEITNREYNKYRDDAIKAENNKDMLAAYCDELSYLKSKQEETGISAMPVSSEGFMKLYADDFEVILTLILIIFLCGLCSKEYESGFISILRTAKRGRQKVFFTKLILAAVLSAAAALAFSALDLSLVFGRYDMSCISSPLFVVRNFASVNSGITIGRYIILVTLLRIGAYVILGVIVSALSGILRSEWGTSGAVLLLFAPYILCGIGLKLFQTIDITEMLSVNRLYIHSMTRGGTALLVITFAAWTAIAALLTTISYRKFCK